MEANSKKVYQSQMRGHRDGLPIRIEVWTDTYHQRAARMYIRDVILQAKQVNWHLLKTATHQSHMIPVWVEHLASQDPALRDNACQNLNDALAYEWSAYEAIGYAIPFMIDLLRCDDMPDKRIVFSSFFWLVGARDTLYGNRHYKALLEAKSLFKSFLYQSNLDLEVMAAGLLSLLVDETTDSGDWFLERLQQDIPIRLRFHYIANLGSWLSMNPIGQRVYLETFNQLAHELFEARIARRYKTSVARTLCELFQDRTSQRAMSFLSPEDVRILHYIKANTPE
jgi:hypothetical protein